MSSRTCSIDGCEALVFGHGWCNRHYKRWRKYGDPLGGGPFRVADKRCSITGCTAKHYGHGYCHGHWRNWYRYGDPEYEPPSDPRLCVIEGCDRIHYARGWCHLHYSRWQVHGDPTIKNHFQRPPLMSDENLRAWFASQLVVQGYSAFTTPCKLWTGSTSRGHGYLSYQGKGIPAHRLAWILEKVLSPTIC